MLRLVRALRMGQLERTERIFRVMGARSAMPQDKNAGMVPQPVIHDYSAAFFSSSMPLSSRSTAMVWLS